MTDRIFNELDSQGAKMEDLSKITYENSATLGIISKLVIMIIGFLIVVGVTSTYNYVEPTPPPQEVTK